jgi:hypothetical protein
MTMNNSLRRTTLGKAAAASALLWACVGLAGCSCFRDGFGHCFGSPRSEPALKPLGDPTLKPLGQDPKAVSAADVPKSDTSYNQSIAQDKFNAMMKQNGLTK